MKRDETRKNNAPKNHHDKTSYPSDSLAQDWDALFSIHWCYYNAQIGISQQWRIVATIFGIYSARFSYSSCWYKVLVNIA